MGMIKKMFNAVSDFGRENDSAILTGTVIVGIITPGILAFQAGRKVNKILDEKREKFQKAKELDKKKNSKDAQNKVLKETVLNIVPVVIPAVVSGGITAACALGVHSRNAKKIAVLSAAYSASESMLKNMNDKMTEQLGPGKVRSLKDSITKDKLAKDTAENRGNVIITGKGDVMCKDMWSGNRFRSSSEKIQQAINKYNACLLQEMYMTLNEFYYELDPRLTCEMGDDLGWHVDDMVSGTIPVHLTAILDDGEPCICIEYDVNPSPNFKYGRM